MANLLRMRRHPFDIISQTATSWNGVPQTLQVSQNVNMLQTANGTMVFACFNQSTQNNSGTLSLSSGGSIPDFLTVPALAQQPLLAVNNWKANNFSVSNISPNNNTPIWIAALGPGVPGQFPVNLPVNGNPLALSPGQAAQGNTLPQWMQLLLRCDTSSLTVFTVIGGPQDPSGNNGYGIVLNASSNTPPPGYYAATTSNSYTFQFNWQGASVYVANMSPFAAAGASATLRQL